MKAGMEQHSEARRDAMKGIAMKTAAALALAMFCFIIGPPAAYGEDIVTVPILTFIGHTGYLRSVAFSPDGTKVLTGSYDNTARLWDAEAGAQIRIFTGHADVVFSVAFSPEGAKVLTGSADDTARLWNAATGAEIGTFQGYVVAFSPDGTEVLTGCHDNNARLWDTATGAHVRTFSGHSAAVRSVAFSPDVQGC